MYKKIISVMSVALVVFLCTSPVYAAGSTGSDNSYIGYHNMNNSNLIVEFQITAFHPYKDMAGTPSTYKFDALCKLEINNVTSNNINIICDGTNRFPFYITTSTNAATNIPWVMNSVEFVGGHLVPSLVGTNSIVYLEPYTGDQYTDSDPNLIIPKNSKLCTYFIVHYSAPIVTDSDLISPNFNSSSVFVPSSNFQFNTVDDLTLNDFNYIPDIYDKLVEILEHYNANAPASEDLTDQSQSVTDTIDNQHQQETSYFNQTQTAIQDTGIQNFQFDAPSLSGLHGIRDDFDAVFLSLGNLKTYFIASLTIGLALAIIRHRRMFSK